MGVRIDRGNWALNALCIGLILSFTNTIVYSQGFAETSETLEVKLREQPRALADVLMIIPNSTQVEVISYEGDNYYKIKYKEKVGYVNEVFLLKNEMVKSLKNQSTSSYSQTKSTRKASSRKYIRGPRGGCYYWNSSGNKTYVDRSLCN